MTGAMSERSGMVAVPVKELRKLLDQAQDVALLVAMAESSVMCLARAAEQDMTRDIPSALEMVGRALAGDETTEQMACRLEKLIKGEVRP